MTPDDFKDSAKKHLIQAALEVLANVVKLGKCDDTNLDVTRSSSLPALLISIVRNLVKSNVKVPDLLSDLIENISLLCKNSFNKQVGIESIYMKGFIPLLPTLMKDPDENLKLNTLKALGTFTSQASIIPVRMQQFYKDISDNGIVKEACDVFRSINAKVTPIHMVAVQAISSMVCPVYGDFYSFPWKRGPHDSILEYNEASATFEGLRL
jgi:hypothetical protein